MKNRIFLVLLMAVISLPAFSGDAATSSAIVKHIYGSVLARFIDGDTLLDNTNKATEVTTIPGWVESSEAMPFGFGYKFKNGESPIVLKSVTFLVATFNKDPDFIGSLKVDVFRLDNEQGFPQEPLATRELRGVRVSGKEKYVEVPLEGLNLEPKAFYAVTVTAPNAEKTRILGFQVPNTPPKLFKGIEMGMPLMRNAAGRWNDFFGNPYVWLQGWSLDDQATNQKAINVLRISSVTALGALAFLYLVIRVARNKRVR